MTDPGPKGPNLSMSRLRFKSANRNEHIFTPYPPFIPYGQGRITIQNKIAASANVRETDTMPKHTDYSIKTT